MRIRDQQILNYVLTTVPVFATEARLRPIIADIITRHSQGVRLSDGELEEIKMARKPAVQSSGGSGSIAVLPLWGVLAPHGGVMVDMSTAATGLDDWCQQFKALVADPAVSTIVLRVNSPGGSAGGVTEAAQTIRDGRAKKTVIAVADGMAASAAFCLASQAEEFYVTPSGMVGAVHCYSIHEDISARLEQAGVKVTLIGQPDAGAAEAPEFLPLSDENLQHAEVQVKQFYDRFVQDVAKGRGVDAATVESSFGRGRVLTSGDARAAGMVDGVMSFDDVLAKLAAGKPLSGSSAKQEAITIGAGIAAEMITSTVEFTVGGGMGGILLDAQPILSAPELAAPMRLAAPTTSAAPAAVTAAVGGKPTNKETNMEAVTLDGTPPTVEELAAQRTLLKAEMDDLNAQAQGRAFTKDEQQSFDLAAAAILGIDAATENMNARNEVIAGIAGNPANGIPGVGINKLQTNAGRRGPQDIFDLSAYRSHAGSIDELPALWRDGAKKANEQARYRTTEQDKTREFVEALLDQDGAKQSHESFSHRMLVTANPLYDAAFGRWVMGRESNADIGMIRMAVSNTGLGSETPVPVTIDPTVLYTGDGARSPLRAISQVVTITGLKWRGIGSDGVTLGYGAETVAINPATPTFSAPDITVVKASGEIQFTVDVDDDWPGLRGELQRMFNQAKMRLEADKFFNGSGTDEPLGIIFALDDDGTSIVDTATANTLTWPDIMGVSDDLPSSFEDNASWVAHKAFYTQAEALAVGEGYLSGWVGPSTGFQGDGPRGVLHGSPAYGASEISKLFTTGGEEVAVIGDFNQGFVIIDRVGLNVELDLHPRDTNGKWTGNRGLVCWFRNNTAVRTPNAFRLLRIKHT